MNAYIRPHRFSGSFRIPASKSHTIRRLLIAALAEGVSEIEYPLDSLDTRSCLALCRGLGADVEEYRGLDPQNPNPPDGEDKRLKGWKITGTGGRPGARASGSGPLRFDVGNSGTTLFLALAVAALGQEPVVFTGDEQIQRRGAAPLLEALSGLGVRAESPGRRGCIPILIQGPWRGGRVSLPCPTSQYLSALLLAAPLAPRGTQTEIDVPLLNEKPYIEMTLSYLKAQNIPFEAAEDFSRFVIPGGAAWQPLSGPVPGDFSSAAFPACAAAVSGGGLRLFGLDPGDTQGDKIFFDMLAQMGCGIRWEKEDSEWVLGVSGPGTLKAGVFDLNAAPDLLPAAAAAAVYAEGDTALVNVAHARIKETDRIAVMAQELARLGGRCTERPDGLTIHGGSLKSGTAPLRGGTVHSHGDHRIAMALAAAALGAAGPVKIEDAGCAAVTYPGFLKLLDGES